MFSSETLESNLRADAMLYTKERSSQVLILCLVRIVTFVSVYRS